MYDLDDAKLDFPFLNENPGSYTLELVNATKGTAKKDRMEYLKLEFDVVESEGDGALAPGERTTVMIKESPVFNDWKADLMAVTAALVKEPIHKVTGEMVAEITSPDQIAKGTKIKATVAFAKKTKTGKNFNRISFAAA